MDRDIETLKGVGETIAKKLGVMGIYTVRDLIYNFPRRYEDYSVLIPVAKITPGPVTIEAQVKQIKGRYVRRGLHITEAVVSDKTGSVRLVWFNQPYRAKATKTDSLYFISGNFEMGRGKQAIMNPNMELASSFPINTARIVPVYRETKGLKSATIRKVMANLAEDIDKLPENLPTNIVKEYELSSHVQSLLGLHFPGSTNEIEVARHRQGFEEIFALSLAALLVKKENDREKALPVPFQEVLARSFVKKLPFDLTDAQRKVIWQIYKDIEKDKPMNRMVEGDVGSGKTVVAAMAALMAISEGYQAALMAPTELLARQHAESMYELLESVGMHREVVLLVGSLKPAEKKRAHERIASGEAKLIIGTHAVISEKVDMHKLALIIVDEQHRFGVEQRQKLQKKAGHMPHMLSMTATPIPRTLALTIYGELDISLLDEMPPGRKPVKTKIVSPNEKARLYKEIDTELERGKQMFVVCPLITESDTLKTLSAEVVYKDFTEKTFKHRKVGLLHGKLKADEKEKIMSEFASGKLDILVATTVIEVGVNVPNASIMLVEGAERFGLAQIHQLRGRVARSTEQGYCYLLMTDSSAPTRRLRAIEQSTDGFKLAELDLEIRGPGAIYGRSQHGQLDLRVANLTDVRLINAARSAAHDFIEKGEKLAKYPELAAQVKENQLVTSLN